jgi:hypothetical protein
MSITETDTEILDTVTIRDIKARPGTGSIYLGKALYSKIEIPRDTGLLLKYNKEKKEICIKLLQY